MNEPAGNIRPDWVSDEMYPFESRFFHTLDGHELHYVDEGAGAPIVFVHGNPSWSFEFRHLIRGLRSDFHCVAPDHIGFGLSSRSERWEDYHPKAHAERLAALLEQLDLREITLFLVDWGGPIGLDFARKRPERVKRIVIANTWCWPVADDRYYVMFSAFMSSWIGQLFIQRFNMFVNQVMPMAVGNKGCLTAPVLEHYRQAQPTPQARRGCAALPGHIVGATDWLASIWGEPGEIRGEADAPILGLQRHCVSGEGTREVEIRVAGLRVTRIPGLRTFPGGRGAGADAASTALIHGSAGSLNQRRKMR